MEFIAALIRIPAGWLEACGLAPATATLAVLFGVYLAITVALLVLLLWRLRRRGRDGR